MKQFKSDICKILDVSDNLLVHPHAWIRESSSTLILSVISELSDPELTESLPDYWAQEKAKSVALKAICQLKCKYVERDHMDACKKLLVFFLGIFKSRLTETAENETKPELLWLLQKLNGVAAEENSDR